MVSLTTAEIATIDGVASIHFCSADEPPRFSPYKPLRWSGLGQCFASSEGMAATCSGYLRARRTAEYSSDFSDY